MHRKTLLTVLLFTMFATAGCSAKQHAYQAPIPGREVQKVETGPRCEAPAEWKRQDGEWVCVPPRPAPPSPPMPSQVYVPGSGYYGGPYNPGYRCWGPRCGAVVYPSYPYVQPTLGVYIRIP